MNHVDLNAGGGQQYYGNLPSSIDNSLQDDIENFGSDRGGGSFIQHPMSVTTRNV